MLPPRLETLAARLDELEMDAMLVTDEINVRYLSGFTGDSSYLLVTRKGTTIMSDGRYDTQIADECPALATAIRPPGQLMQDLLAEVIKGSGQSRVGFEAAHVTVASLAVMTESCPDIQWIETSGVVEQQRMIKDADEIETTRKAVEIAQRSFQAVLPMITTASSEREIAHDLEAKMRTLGAEGVSFAPIVAAGAAGALPHYRPGPAMIGDSATLLVDWGTCYDGYASDLTRTFHRQTASDAFRRAYDVVLEAQLAAIAAIGPGVAASDVDRAAREILEKAGLGDAFKHGLGHGTGLQIHESPRMSSVSDEILDSGMIITVEPGVYFEGDFGIRIEDDVLVTPEGAEVLSSLAKGLDDCRLML